MKSLLIRNQKFEFLAHSVAGLCHEIRNLMTPFILLDFIKINLNKKEQNHIKEIIESKKQIITLMDEIRDLYRPYDDIEYITISDIIKVIKKSINLVILNRKFNKEHIKIKLSKKINKNISIIFSQNKLLQVLINLIQNSIDAIQKKILIKDKKYDIIIYISLSKKQFEEKKLLLSVIDYGEGILKENIKKIWVPQFSTKKEIGTGLGLYIIKNIAKKYSSKISCKSILNKKTIFTISIPVKT